MRRGKNNLAGSLMEKVKNKKWRRTLPVYEIEKADRLRREYFEGK